MAELKASKETPKHSASQSYGWGIGIAAVFVVLVLVVFYDLIFGNKVILGIDGNYSMRLIRHQFAHSGSSGWWNAFSWLGEDHGAFPVWTYVLFQRFFPSGVALTAAFSFALLFSFGFSFAFLRRLKVSQAAAVFGSIAYTLTPHYLTLIYPAHVSVVCFIPYVPMLFYFLHVALAAEVGEAKQRTIGAALLGGACWGMLMNEDPQRGLYVSLAAVAYILFLTRGLGLLAGGGSPKGEKIRILRGSVGKLALCFLVLILVAYNGLRSQMGGANLQSGGGEQAVEQTVEQKWNFSTGWSLDPKELIDSLAFGYHGKISGDPDSPYWGTKPITHNSDSLGFFVLAFALAGVILGFRKKPEITFFALLGVFFLLLACGSYMPGKPLFWLWWHVPMMDKFRVPLKFMAVTVFCFSVISAFGFDSLVQMARGQCVARVEKVFKAIAIGLAVFCGLVFVNAFSGGEQGLAQLAGGRLSADAIKTAVDSMQGAAGRALILALLFLASVWAILLGQKKRFVPVIGLFVLLSAHAYDLVSIDRFYVKRAAVDLSKHYQPDGVIQYLQKNAKHTRAVTSLKIQSGGRMVPLSITALGNQYITYMFPYFGVECFDSTPKARMPADYNQFFGGLLSGIKMDQTFVRSLINANVRLLQVSNVEYLVTDGYLYGASQRPIAIAGPLQQHPHLEQVTTVQGYGGRKQIIYRVKNAVPRFGFYGASVNVAGPKEVLDELAKPKFLPRQQAVLSTPDTPVFNGSGPVVAQQVLESRPGYYKIQVEADSAGIFSIAHKYSKSWKLMLNDQPVDLIPVNFLLSGAVISEAGNYTAELVFSPDVSRVRVSQLGLMAAVLVGGILFIFPLLGCATRKHG